MSKFMKTALLLVLFMASTPASSWDSDRKEGNHALRDALHFSAVDEH
jgi:hypothetical protein